jgi:hypothetical protein
MDVSLNVPSKWLVVYAISPKWLSILNRYAFKVAWRRMN